VLPHKDTVSAFWAERYDVIKLLRQSRYSVAFLGRYKASNIPVLIEIFNRSEAIDHLALWDKCSKDSLILDTILERGIFGERLFFSVSKFPVSDIYVSLSQIGNLYLDHIISIGVQLCDILHFLHSNNLHYLTLDPTRIVVKPHKDNLELITLHKKNLNHALGYELIDSAHENTKEMLQDDYDLERLYLASEKAPLLEGAEKLLTQFTGWQYSTANPFVAPEVCLGEDTSGADIYSVAMILYWLITKKVPLKIEDVVDGISQKLNVPSELKNEIRINKVFEIVFGAKFHSKLPFNEIPPEISSVLIKGMNPPKKRFDSILALKKSLTQIPWKTLRFVVKDPKGHPVKNAVVQIHSTTYPALIEELSSSTDSDGRVSFFYLCSGNYLADINHSMFYPEKKSQIKIADDPENDPIVITLKPLSFWDKLNKK
jgi:serine/threonine protein kinase